jgi:hypothetical protein
MAREMHESNEDQRALIKAKMKVSPKKKRQFRFNNLKAITNMGVLLDVEFKDKVFKGLKFITRSPHPNCTQLDP